MVSAVLIRPERGADAAAVRAIHRLAFGRDDEAALVDRLRDAGDVVVALVADVDDEAVGHIVFSRLATSGNGQATVVAALAPLAVYPAHQGRGIGGALIREGLAACRERGVDAVTVLGEPAYYSRFGFSAKMAERLASPYAGPSFMALALTPRCLREPFTVRYPRAFAGESE